MERLVAAAVILGICFWPASVAVGLGWWMGRLERRLDPQNADLEPPGVPGYLIVTGVLAALGAVLAGWAFSLLFWLN